MTKYSYSYLDGVDRLPEPVEGSAVLLSSLDTVGVLELRSAPATLIEATDSLTSDTEGGGGGGLAGGGPSGLARPLPAPAGGGG